MTWNEKRERIIAAAELGDATPRVSVDLLVDARNRAFNAEQTAKKVQAELDVLKAAHVWIKTSERMPDAADGSCCDVLAIIDGTAIVLNYTPDDSVHPWADEFSNIYRADEVTHWQPLPEAPK